MMQITRVLKQTAERNACGIATIDIESGSQKTWREFTERAVKLAGALLSLGLKRDDRVAALTRNSDVHLKYYLATIWAGGIFVPLNTRLTSHEISRLLGDCGAKIVVADDHTYTKLDELSKPKHTIFTGKGYTPDGCLEHESFLKSGKPATDINRGGEDMAMILYTGGTTGQPKGAILTHNNIISNSHSALSILDDGKPWRYLHAAPMYHIADCQWNAGVTMIAGTHLFLEKFEPDQVLSIINRYKITHTALVPTMIKMLCDVLDINSHDLSSLRIINFGGSPISPELIQRARKTFPECKFIQGYGLTETSPNISMLPDRYNSVGDPKIESAGKPVPGMSVKIVDENSEELTRGKIGEIITKGPHVMAGYWNNPKETEKTIRNAWLHTGDLGYMDEDRFIYIVDRLKDMIITGGENVYSTEVETVIEKLDEVDSCSVIGIPDEKWGEAVHAIVVPKEYGNLTEYDIKTHCRKVIADYKCPKSVEIRREPMPTNGPGKILKRKLRKPFWADGERQVN